MSCHSCVQERKQREQDRRERNAVPGAIPAGDGKIGALGGPDRQRGDKGARGTKIKVDLASISASSHYTPAHANGGGGGMAYNMAAGNGTTVKPPLPPPPPPPPRRESKTTVVGAPADRSQVVPGSSWKSVAAGAAPQTPRSTAADPHAAAAVPSPRLQGAAPWGVPAEQAGSAREYDTATTTTARTTRETDLPAVSYEPVAGFMAGPPMLAGDVGAWGVASRPAPAAPPAQQPARHTRLSSYETLGDPHLKLDKDVLAALDLIDPAYDPTRQTGGKAGYPTSRRSSFTNAAPAAGDAAAATGPAAARGAVAKGVGFIVSSSGVEPLTSTTSGGVPATSLATETASHSSVFSSAASTEDVLAAAGAARGGAVAGVVKQAESQASGDLGLLLGQGKQQQKYPCVDLGGLSWGVGLEATRPAGLAGHTPNGAQANSTAMADFYSILGHAKAGPGAGGTAGLNFNEGVPGASAVWGTGAGAQGSEGWLGAGARGAERDATGGADWGVKASLASDGSRTNWQTGAPAPSEYLRTSLDHSRVQYVPLNVAARPPQGGSTGSVNAAGHAQAGGGVAKITVPLAHGSASAANGTHTDASYGLRGTYGVPSGDGFGATWFEDGGGIAHQQYCAAPTGQGVTNATQLPSAFLASLGLVAEDAGYGASLRSTSAAGARAGQQQPAGGHFQIPDVYGVGNGAVGGTTAPGHTVSYDPVLPDDL